MYPSIPMYLSMDMSFIPKTRWVLGMGIGMGIKHISITNTQFFWVQLYASKLTFHTPKLMDTYLRVKEILDLRD